MDTSALVSKVWSFANLLRHDGVNYLDYTEQFTLLLFLKMADEYSKPPHNRKMDIPAKYNWSSLTKRSGADLEDHYRDLLKNLARSPGLIGQIFLKTDSQISDPAKLFRLISMIDEESWLILDADVKGDIYESLLSKNAESGGKGAGQYFTPRALIGAMVECVRPIPKKTIADPACGTGGFFLGAYDYLVRSHRLDKAEKEFLKRQTFRGNEIDPKVRRLCLMNLFLHGIGDMAQQEVSVLSQDALVMDSGHRFDYVLANPPFGTKGGGVTGGAGSSEDPGDFSYNRQDFWVTTSNKQLNFLQHIKTILKVDGMAAVVLPDNVLFEDGVGETIRRKLLQTTNLHTILRLPTGIFYANGVKANVLFFDNKPAAKDPWTKEVWFYDYRTNIRHTLKKNPIKMDHLKDFIKCFNPENKSKRKETWSDKSPDGRWRKFSYDELTNRDKCSLDVFWLKDDGMVDPDSLPEPNEIAAEIVASLESALAKFRAVAKTLSQ